MASLRARIERRGFTDPRLRKLLGVLRKSSSAFWKKVAWELSRPRRRRVAVNLGKINRLAKEGYVVVVPGKVLGGGHLNKAVKVAAYAFSKKAAEEIKRAGGTALTLEELFKENPEGKMTLLVV